jgi:hypothetical protein
MLLPILVIVAFLAALTGAVLENGQRAARVALDAAVARYAAATLADGIADFTTGLAAFVAAHGTGGPWPAATSVSAPKSACAAAPAPAACPFRYIVSAVITGAMVPDDDSGAVTATNVQSEAIDEGRLSAAVTVTIVGADGKTALGSRTRMLTYRVFGSAPFAVISGARDSAAVDGAQSAAPGDSGGTIATVGTPADAGVDDTRIHVRLTCSTVIDGVVPFVNDQQAAGNDGLPWGNAPAAAYEAPCSTPDVPADAFRDERWTNGDGNATGWSQ